MGVPMPSNLRLLSLVVLFSCALVSPAKAQQKQGPATPTPGMGGSGPPMAGGGSITIQVFPAPGKQFENGDPKVSISTSLGGPVMVVPERISQDRWMFQGLESGVAYMIQVQAVGYQTRMEPVSLATGGMPSANVAIYMIPTGRPGSTSPPPPGNFVLSPRAERELQRAIKYLKSSKTSKAREHLEKALKMAPSVPRLNYLMGWSYLHDHETAKAIPYLEKAISVEPGNLAALQSLGIARYQQGDYRGSIDMLGKAIAQGLSSWQAQWILASSYLRVRNYEQARLHAEAALKIDKKKASGAELVLGQALAELGLRKQAIDAFDFFLKEHSQAPEAPRVREIVKRLHEPAPPAPNPAPAPESPTASEPAKTVAGKTAASATAGASGAKAPSQASSTTIAALVPASSPPAPPPAVPRKENWAPPDVAALKPRITSNKACPLPSLLKRTGQDTVEWVKDLQEFTATEEYQSAEITGGGKVGNPFEKQFSYMVLIHKPRPHLLSVDELRRPEPNLAEMGAPVVSMGGPALALVFHPFYRQDYSWSCDGLGEWKHQPAWIVRFTQVTSRPTATLESFQSARGSSLLPIKGIAWISEKGNHVMHLETDLLKPIQSVGLDREHYSINYEQVAFRSHPVKLWLPESVDVYITLRGHSYHNYSRYSDFLLFWTGTKQVIGSVKQGRSQH